MPLSMHELIKSELGGCIKMDRKKQKQDTFLRKNNEIFGFNGGDGKGEIKGY